MHYLSETATTEYEAARRKLQRFINAREEREVIFTSGTTDGINLVMQGWGRKFVGAGDEIILTDARAPLEHRAVADAGGRERRDDHASCRSTTPANC